MQIKEIAPATAVPTPTPDVRSDITPVQSKHPDVQELITRVNANQELDCLSLDRGDHDFIAAIYMEVSYNPDFHPTSEILQLIRAVNARMRVWSSDVKRN